MPSRRKPLTPRQAQFVAEYLKDLNGAAAARRAGFSAATADRIAYRLLRKVEIEAAVKDARDRLLLKAEVSAVRTVEEARRMAYNPGIIAFVDARGNLKPFSEWTPEMSAAVASVEFVRRNLEGGDGHSDELVKLKFWNKNHATELLFKHHGLLEQPDANDDRPTVPVYVLPEGARVATK